MSCSDRYNATCSHVSACEGAIDPMNGATIPDNYVAVELFVNGRTEWETEPPYPTQVLPTLLLNQAGGGILIDESLYLAIE
jgi:hypothetical protein